MNCLAWPFASGPVASASRLVAAFFAAWLNASRFPFFVAKRCYFSLVFAVVTEK